MQIEQENEISSEILVFFDRAIPDALVYYHFLKLEMD
jgi:predicted ATPase